MLIDGCISPFIDFKFVYNFKNNTENTIIFISKKHLSKIHVKVSLPSSIMY